MRVRVEVGMTLIVGMIMSVFRMFVSFDSHFSLATTADVAHVNFLSTFGARRAC
jgi:hypothetical protein